MQELKDLEGNTLLDKEKPVTLKSVCVQALMAVDTKEEVNGEEKYKRYQLTQKIGEKEEVDLSTEEISKIKQLIGKSFVTLVVGQSWDMLENK